MNDAKKFYVTKNTKTGSLSTLLSTQSQEKQTLTCFQRETQSVPGAQALLSSCGQRRLAPCPFLSTKPTPTAFCTSLSAAHRKGSCDFAGSFLPAASLRNRWGLEGCRLPPRLPPAPCAGQGALKVGESPSGCSNLQFLFPDQSASRSTFTSGRSSLPDSASG